MTAALRALALAAIATLFGTALMAPAQAAAPVDLQPEDLSRGSDITIAHIEYGDLVVGSRTVDVGGGRAYVLGRSGRSWLVGTSDESGGGHFRIVRVKPDDTVTVLKRGISFFELKLSENGRYFVQPGRGTRKAIPIRVFSSLTGELKVSKDFAHYPTVLGMDANRVLLSTWTTGDTGIASWDIATGAVTKISRRPANLVDIGNDLLASYTKDPYEGGCMVLSRLSDPSTRLWKSCTDRVAAFSPDGEKMATISILSDGIGPGVVNEREIDGTLMSSYSTNWFGGIYFEDDTDLMLEVNGDTLSSTVRCDDGTCANATDPVAVQQPRLSPGRPSARFGSWGAASGAWQTPQS
jgi:hypothetical protein